MPSVAVMSESDPPEEYGTYSVEEEDQLPAEDTLGDGAGSDVADELDRGYSPPERWSAAQGYGNTPYEEAVGESLDQRLAQEEPDTLAADPDPAPDEQDEEPEVGDDRAGRLLAPDAGAGEDVEPDLVAEDVGIDGAAASAEEAAVHVIEDDDPAPGR